MMRNMLLFLSKQNWMRNVVSRFPISRAVARRFVAGETIDDVVTAARELNAKGMRVTVDHLGEHITDPAESKAAHTEYLTLVDRLHGEKLDANVSVKLTEMGLDIDVGLCRSQMTSLIERAASAGMFVRVDMESSAYTQRTLDLYHELRSRHENVGIVLQSYLHRTPADLETTLAAGSRVRLCKGAYNEPPAAALQEKTEVDRAYVALTRRLLQSKLFHGIATHDTAMVDATRAAAKELGVGPDAYEFQMLYGVRRDLQERLVREGMGMRVYIPYGENWYPYLMRRMAERPANLLFVTRALLGN